MTLFCKPPSSAASSWVTASIASLVGVLGAATFWVLFPAVSSRYFYAMILAAGAGATAALYATKHTPALQPSGMRSLQHISQILMAFLLALLGIALACALLSNIMNLWYFFHYNLVDVVVDGREIAKMWALSHGNSMYPDMQGYPFFITLYTPLYHALSAVLSFFTPNVVIAAHSVTYFADFALFLLLAAWIWRETGVMFIALLFPLLLLSSPYLALYPWQTRPDLLAWLFAYSAVFAISPVFDRQQRPAWLIPAAVLAALALMTKQQTTPVAVALASAWVIRRGNFFRCLTFGLVVLAGVGSACLVLQYLTGGSFFMHTLIYPASLAADKSVTDYNFAVPRALQFVKDYWGVLIVYALALGTALRARKFLLLDWVVLVHIPFLVKIISTWGADNNYFIGILLALGIRAGIFLARLWKEQGLAAPAVLILLLFMAPQLPGSLNLLPPDPGQATETEAAELRAIASQGKTLINSEGSAPFYTTATPPPLYLFDVADMGFFEQVGLWKFLGSQLERDISSRRFDHVILSDTFIVPNYMRTVGNAYTPVRKFSHHTVYAPKKGTLLFFDDLPDTPVRLDGFALSLDHVQNLVRETGFGAKSLGVRNEQGLGEAVLALKAEQTMKTLTLTVYPKVIRMSPDDFLEAQWSTDGKTYTPFLRYGGTGKDTSLGLFEPAVTGSFSPESSTVTVRIVLCGSAKIWFGPQAPMIFHINGLDDLEPASGSPAEAK